MQGSCGGLKVSEQFDIVARRLNATSGVRTVYACAQIGFEALASILNTAARVRLAATNNTLSAGSATSGGPPA